MSLNKDWDTPPRIKKNIPVKRSPENVEAIEDILSSEGSTAGLCRTPCAKSRSISKDFLIPKNNDEKKPDSKKRFDLIK